MTKNERIEALENAFTTVLTRLAQANVSIEVLERKVAMLEAATLPYTPPALRPDGFLPFTNTMISGVAP